MFNGARENAHLILGSVRSSESGTSFSRLHCLSGSGRLQDILVTFHRVRLRQHVKDLVRHQGVVGAGVVADEQFYYLTRGARKFYDFFPTDVLIIIFSAGGRVAHVVLLVVRAVEPAGVDVDHDDVVRRTPRPPERLGTVALAQILGHWQDCAPVFYCAAIFAQHF